MSLLHSLDWLKLHQFVGAVRREHDWVFQFDRNVSIAVGCLWRLVHDGRICLTGQDDGHQFGLTEPLNAEQRLTCHLANSAVIDVELREGLLDLRIYFDDPYVLEIIPDSSGYEAWTTNRGNMQFIAVGGGELATVHDASVNAEQSDERAPE